MTPDRLWQRAAQGARRRRPLAAEGIEAEVIDLRVLRPLDAATILASVAKTRRCRHRRRRLAQRLARSRDRHAHRRGRPSSTSTRRCGRVCGARGADALCAASGGRRSAAAGRHRRRGARPRAPGSGERLPHAGARRRYGGRHARRMADQARRPGQSRRRRRCRRNPKGRHRGRVLRGGDRLRVGRAGRHQGPESAAGWRGSARAPHRRARAPAAAPPSPKPAAAPAQLPPAPRDRRARQSGAQRSRPPLAAAPPNSASIPPCSPALASTARSASPMSKPPRVATAAPAPAKPRRTGFDFGRDAQGGKSNSGSMLKYGGQCWKKANGGCGVGKNRPIYSRAIMMKRLSGRRSLWAVVMKTTARKDVDWLQPGWRR